MPRPRRTTRLSYLTRLPLNRPPPVADDWARRPRLVTTVVFATQSLLFASWTAHIPLVKAQLGLDDGQLGLVLFGAPIGSVLATLVASWLLPRVGSRRLVQASLLGYCATGWMVGLAGSGLELFLVLLVWGAFQGTTDVSMNAQAVSVERLAGRPLMSGFHAAWSIGAFAGAALGTVAVALGAGLAFQLAAIGFVIAVGVGLASRALVPDPPPADEDGAAPRLAAVWLNPVVVALGLIALASMLCEGAAADWSAVYLHDSLGAAPAIAALGYTFYSLAMVVSRLMGDRVLARTAPRTTLPLLAGVATVGMTVGLVVGTPLAALLGFATLGLGLALVVPAVFSAAGRLPGVHPGSAVAAVSAIGWVGFVAGPPVIGHLADAFTLPVAFALLPILTAGVAVAVRRSRSFNAMPVGATTTEAPLGFPDRG
jgi:MFS family permease